MEIPLKRLASVRYDVALCRCRATYSITSSARLRTDCGRVSVLAYNIRAINLVGTASLRTRLA
jgi:hypothetical protein